MMTGLIPEKSAISRHSLGIGQPLVHQDQVGLESSQNLAGLGGATRGLDLIALAAQELGK
jgi:hypothetical protein